MSAEWAEWADYLAGDLDPARDAVLERELFEDVDAPPVVERFLATVDAIRLIRDRHGTLTAALLPDGLSRLRTHATLLEWQLPRGEVRDGWIPEDVDVCIAELAVDLEGIGVVDLEFVDGQGHTYMRMHDVPVDREAGRVLVACERHMALKEEVTIFRLVTHDRHGRRVLGDYGVRNVPPAS